MMMMPVLCLSGMNASKSGRRIIRRRTEQSGLHQHVIFFVTATVCALLLSSSAASVAAASTDERPNFIFIFADDLGFGDLKSYGHPYAKTPNLDRLAAEGTRFTQFHMTGNVCPNSRAGLMTSRNPSWFPNYTQDYGFLGVPTVTNILQDAGYRTAHIGKWNIGPTPEDATTSFPEYGIDHLRLLKTKPDDPTGRERLRFDAALAFLQKHVAAQNVATSTKNNDASSERQPFYMNLWLTATHAPIQPHVDLIKPFQGLSVDRSKFGNNDLYMQAKFDEMISRGGNIDELMQLYLAEVYGLDLQVGRLLDLLDQLNLADNTVVVFTSDNGPAGLGTSLAAAGWAGGLRGGKHSYYQGGIVVPFLLRWPAGHVPAGVVNNESFLSSLDWLPTVGRLAGANVPWDWIEGEDVSDIWTGQSSRSRTNPMFYRSLQGQNHVTMRHGNWKLLEWAKELYNLDTDPAERINLYNADDEHTAIVQAMRQSIQAWEATLPADHARLPREQLPFDPTKQATVIGPPDERVVITTTPVPSTAPTRTTMSPVVMVVDTAPSMTQNNDGIDDQDADYSSAQDPSRQEQPPQANSSATPSGRNTVFFGSWMMAALLATALLVSSDLGFATVPTC